VRACGLGTHFESTAADSETVKVGGHPVLPLSEFHTASFQDADPLIEMLQRYVHLPEEMDEYLRICVNEVLQNIVDHANSPIGGIMTARFMEQAQEVRVAIVDRGRGILTTLRQRYPDTSPDNVLRRVFGGHYTARSRENNLGLGISNLVRIIERLRGDYFIVSELSTAEFRRGKPRQFGNLFLNFAGTGVFFTLPVHG
jgi:hypothetical protein